MEELLNAWLEEPVRNLNLLNSLIPKLIQEFDAHGDKKSAVRQVISTIETIREELEERNILSPREYASIVDPSADTAQQGVSDKAKAATFVCSRLALLLTHICANAGKSNVKEIVRLIMPFVQGALESLQDTETDPVDWLSKCQLLATLFERVVVDDDLVLCLNKELFFKNLDTSLLLLVALKSQFESLKLNTAYELLVTVVPQLTEQGVQVLDSVFIDVGGA